jgi:hypothetical protein
MSPTQLKVLRYIQGGCIVHEHLGYQFQGKTRYLHRIMACDAQGNRLNMISSTLRALLYEDYIRVDQGRSSPEEVVYLITPKGGQATRLV